MKINPIRRRGFTLVELLVVIVIIASLAALSAPMIIGKVKEAHKAEAISNAKQIGLAMFDFENDYGSYPDGTTLADVAEAFPDADVEGEAGEDSNGYFKQLLQAGIIQSEEVFYAKAQGTKNPDGDISGSEALAAREVGFGYILNGDTGLSTAGNSSRVIVVTPLAEDGTNFDADPFGGSAVTLRIDQSATTPKIRPPKGSSTGPAIIGGKSLLEAEFWGDATPTIKAPKK
ncbi:MAG: prepilin-type N-terminal cleavage/methylation domain-containing protein [Verrucomicrobiota bacterium]